MQLGVDYSASAEGWSASKYTSFAKALKASGRVFAARYLGLGWPSGKGISKTELDALVAAGISVCFFYEEGTQDSLGGVAKAQEHAAKAKAALQALGIDPANQPVMYCTDTDARLSQVEAYYAELVRLVGLKNVWAYGGYTLMKNLFDRGLISGCCQSQAWSYIHPDTGAQYYGEGRVLAWDSRAQLRQHGENQTTVVIDGINCNADSCYGEDYGQYPRPNIVTPPVPVPGDTMTLADQMRANALLKLGMEYEWGDEFEYVIGGDSTLKPTDGDCSGFYFAVARKTGLKWKNGAVWPRLTAAGYASNAVPVTDAPRIGDPIFFRNSTRVYHIAMVIGKNANGQIETMEARGERWGVVRYLLDKSDPNSVLNRGGKIYRFPWLDLGVQSGVVTPVPIPSQPEVKLGDINEAVREAQIRVVAHIGQEIYSDGDFGPLTDAAIRFFQKLKGLKIDGIVGDNTWDALKKTPIFPMLQKDTNVPHVWLMKRRMRHHGFQNLDETNITFGPETEKSVRAFQQAKGLGVDGVCGPNTWAALLKR